VDHISVEGPSGDAWNFPCGSWFGANDPSDPGDTQGAGGTLERNLLPCPTRDVPLRTRPLEQPLRVRGEDVRSSRPSFYCVVLPLFLLSIV
jgi:hypothetical protein